VQTVAVIASFRSRLFMDTLGLLFPWKNDARRHGVARPHAFMSVSAARRPCIPLWNRRVGQRRDTADVCAHGGRGGVGMRNALPWVDAKPPVMH